MSTTAPSSHPAQSRKATRLNHKLDRNLIAYVNAAAAAGVGMLSLAQPAQASIVATSTNITVSNIGGGIDLNGDGVTDITICWCEGASHSAGLVVGAPVGNGWVGNRSGITTFFGVYPQVQALFFGLPIGSGENFQHGYAEIARIFGNSISITGSSGNWLGKVNRYVGVKFQISGATHFGWIRLTVKNPTGTLGDVTATITGYAYETIANRGLKAGHTSGLATKASSAHAAEMLAPTKMPAMLGLLARGADTIAIWRREEETLPRG